MQILGCYKHFLEICSTFTIKGVSKDAILLRLFLFSLLGRRSNGSMPTKIETLRGKIAPLPS